MEKRHSISGGGHALLRMFNCYVGSYTSADRYSSSETTDARGDQHIMMHFHVRSLVFRDLVLANKFRLTDPRTMVSPGYTWSNTEDIASTYISISLWMSRVTRESILSMKIHPRPKTARSSVCSV
jgi:hypothetical protein